MSTVSTMSSVSPSQSTHGQGRRGHNRSRQWSQSPSSFAMTQNGQVTTEASPAQSNGHTSEPSESRHHQHHHSHHHSSSFQSFHTQKDGIELASSEQLPKPDLSKDALLGNPGPSTTFMRQLPEKWNDLPPSYEIMTGFLTALPWVVLSWYLRRYSEPTSHKFFRLLKQAANKNKEKSIPTQHFDTRVDGVLWRTTALVAVTMLMVGVWSVMRRQKAGQANPDMSRLQSVRWDLETAQTALKAVVSLGLPVYAAMKVGGVMVALSLALTYASGLPTIFEQREKQGNASRDRIGQKKATLLMLSVFVILCAFHLDAPPDITPLKGYVALAISVFILRPPFAKARDAIQAPSQPKDDSMPTFTSTIQSLIDQQAAAVLTGPLNSTPADIRLTLLSGATLAVLSLVWAIFSGSSYRFGIVDIVGLVGTAASLAGGLVLSSPSSLRTRQKKGFVVTCAMLVFFGALPHEESSRVGYLVWTVLGGFSYFASLFDDPRSHSMLGIHDTNGQSDDDLSTITKFLLQRGESMPVLYSIVKEDDSRRIFYFMILNFAFMLVQLSYGFITGSLGLLSDSIHMFFDCLALVVGLSAAVMSRWPPSERFPYGYGKVDTLSGFANGVFLMIISVEIVYEAVERLLSGSEMHRLQELLIVSLAGLAVNLVGIMAFDHAHTHSHGGHGHDHGHSHANENMHGIFLHILADTMGSVAVVISTILVHYYGWAGFDPIASCIIAILIFASAVPLVSSTAKSLLLTLPDDVEYSLRDTLGGLSGLRGVVGYTVPKFWLDETATSSGHDHHHHHHHSNEVSHKKHDHKQSQDDHARDHNHSHSHGHHDHSHSHSHNHSHSHSHSHKHDDHDHHHSDKAAVLGVIHVIASRSADLEEVRRRTVEYLEERGMNIVVQVEREGDVRCWCGNGLKSS